MVNLNHISAGESAKNAVSNPSHRSSVATQSSYSRKKSFTTNHNSDSPTPLRAGKKSGINGSNESQLHHRNSSANSVVLSPRSNLVSYVSTAYLSTTKLVADNRRLVYEIEVMKYEKLLATLPRVVSVVDMQHQRDDI
jgi:hypothetical protein